jgi:hypothetical protein
MPPESKKRKEADKPTHKEKGKKEKKRKHKE